ncbi:carbon-nitrogen family hydrolase [Staphylococcus arlettae]|uniref:carbon-nitrogen family hydrolase n=1 Tax=Staphylococcus arlettae TaxID=29378 RepID=UPI001E6022C8|nr:carbon-nitrogen family hydrolase [Staphylococcus arlettae]MCD8842354.1 carbon-nitrogen family hydrolase [Staphylococcus arlettae]
MNIQIFQLQIEPANVSTNEKKIQHWFEQNLNSETDVVVLPEMWNQGYALSQLDILADNDLQRSYNFIAQLAKMYQVDIVAGSVANKKDGKIFNTAFTVLKDQILINSYDKTHLVPMLDEPTYLTAGSTVPENFQLSSGVAVTQIICYDLRFPELLRYPARTGAKIAFYVAQWPAVRLDHWRALLQARAIENDIFIVACNSCGDDGNTEYAGHSMVISPNGEIIAEASNLEKRVSVTLNISEVNQQRQNIPVFDNLRLDLYK